jgi:hypothetical protein
MTVDTVHASGEVHTGGIEKAGQRLVQSVSGSLSLRRGSLTNGFSGPAIRRR